MLVFAFRLKHFFNRLANQYLLPNPILDDWSFSRTANHCEWLRAAADPVLAISVFVASGYDG